MHGASFIFYWALNIAYRIFCPYAVAINLFLKLSSQALGTAHTRILLLRHPFGSATIGHWCG